MPRPGRHLEGAQTRETLQEGFEAMVEELQEVRRQLQELKEAS